MQHENPHVKADEFVSGATRRTGMATEKLTIRMDCTSHWRAALMEALIRLAKGFGWEIVCYRHDGFDVVLRTGLRLTAPAKVVNLRECQTGRE
jgi:hypothetical protein